MDGTKTTSSLQCQHLNGTGSSPSPPSPPAAFRCPQSTTLVGLVCYRPCQMKIDTASETGKPLEFNVKMCFFSSSQPPVPRRLLPCWASKSIETLSEIIREHSQLCNFIITKGTTVSIKTSIQVLKQCTHLKAFESPYGLHISSLIQTVSTAVCVPDCNHRLPSGPLCAGHYLFYPS